MEKKEESKLRISEYLHSLRISGGYKTLREWCRLNDFSDVLWSHLENNLWEIVPMGKKIYTQQELDKAREEGRLSVIQELLFEPEEPSHNISTLEAAFKYEDIIKRYSEEWRNKTKLISPKYIKSKLKDNK